MKEKFKRAYMDVAYRFAELSYATRLKVGAIIVKDDRIISIGYNGTPTNWDNDCEDIEWCTDSSWLSTQEILENWPYEGTYIDNNNEIKSRYRLVTKSEVLHAEMNCISKLAKSNESGNNADLFVTHSPCLECAKLVYQSGIRNVYFGEHYRDDKGLTFLRKSGITVEQVNRVSL